MKGLSKNPLNLLKLYAKLCIHFPRIRAYDFDKCSKGVPAQLSLGSSIFQTTENIWFLNAVK